MKKTLWIATVALMLPVAAFAEHHGDSEHGEKGATHQKGDGDHHMMKNMPSDMKHMMQQCMEGGMGKEGCMAKHERMKDMHGDDKHHMMKNMHGDGADHKDKAYKAKKMKSGHDAKKQDHKNDAHKH